MGDRLKEYLKEIDRKREGLEQLSDAIWGFAETAFSEYKSVEALKDFLKAEGFELTDHAYGVETVSYTHLPYPVPPPSLRFSVLLPSDFRLSISTHLPGLSFQIPPN